MSWNKPIINGCFCPLNSNKILQSLLRFNGEYTIVVEVKYKLHPDDVDDFVNRKLVKFKSLFPEYANKGIIGAVAGMSVPSDSYELAAKHGLLVLTQSGENMFVMNPEGFELKEF